MDLTGVIVAFTIINTIDLGTSIKCFNCAVTAEILAIGYDQIITPSCSNFDGSSKYIIDCPYSTMCSRIIAKRHLQNGYEQQTTTVGCAQQKRLRHVLYNGKWMEEYSVEEVYTEECKTMGDSNHLFGATKTYCYCRGDLCNSPQQRLTQQFNSAQQQLVFISAYYFLLPILIFVMKLIF
ncbi:hypothetical protein CVS40_12915 [Lucilia cuprina]|nr:hypothetical protein CVS40_12915 [Lucilia cuprina]